MMTGEMLGAQLSSLHNLYFYLHLMRENRAALDQVTIPDRAERAAGARA
jgi:queuine/archaeosine tRNA-ribosyltransferase